MKRRDFSIACGAALAGTALVQTPALAQIKPPQAGTDYVVLKNPAPVEAPAGKVEVVEFFWYSCPHCNAFEPMFDAWSKLVPKDVMVHRVPIAFRDDFAPQQRLFYALEAMGLLDKLHSKVYGAIHVEKQNLSKADEIADWFIQDMIKKEDSGRPLSDQDIADMLKKEGLPVARRTVSKYREELGILSSRIRKEF